MYVYSMEHTLKHFVVQRENQIVQQRDIDLVFGPLEAGEEILVIDHDDLATMAVEAGLFPSKGQSRRNGLGGPAPHGLHQIGTKKRRFWVWNPVPSVEKVTLNPSFDRTLGWFK
jgi:hypothetical protein